MELGGTGYREGAEVSGLEEEAHTRGTVETVLKMDENTTMTLTQFLYSLFVLDANVPYRSPQRHCSKGQRRQGDEQCQVQL